MRVVTERDLIIAKKMHSEGGSNMGVRLIDFFLAHNLQEIDTLTVSKLRPMCDAPKDGEWFLGYYKGEVSEYFEILFYSKLSGKLRSNGDEFEEDDVLGWLPLPIYKPELNGASDD